MSKFHIILSIFFIAFCFSESRAQVLVEDSLKKEKEYNFLEWKIMEMDTLPTESLEPVIVYGKKKWRNSWWRQRRNRRLVRNLKKVYPYAKTAGKMFNEMNVEFVKLETESEKKEYIKKMEVRIREEYEGELKKLTISQGRLLIKLIDRETGATSYELLKEFRGRFSAVFWQTLARLFGSNLKMNYDPEGEDKLIEYYITLLEQGKL